MTKKVIALLLTVILGLLLFWLENMSILRLRRELDQTNPFTVLKSHRSSILKTPVRGEDNIFFIDSSCAVSGPNKITLSMNPRQACAVESAAYQNPMKNIYYLDTCLDIVNLSATSVGDMVHQLFYYNNVYVFHLQLVSYLENTPLEEWVKLGKLNTSKYPIEHASDILRLVTLWKYGGLYLDLDMIVMRPLDALGWDFVVPESNYIIGNSVMSFTAGGVGHQLVELCLKNLAETYNGDIWDFNGPLLLTRIMGRVCDFMPVKKMTAKQCGGINVKPTATFFPYPWQLWQLLFKEETEDFTMSLLQQEATYSVHAWNKMSRNEEVKVGSKQPYAQLAARFCRRAYFTAGSTL